MESSFTEIVAQLNLVDLLGLCAAGVLLFSFIITQRTHHLMFTLVLSAALVGSTVPVLGDIAPLVRWLAIFLFAVVGILGKKITTNPGFFLMWLYALLGFISLFRAISFGYQFQRSILLIVMVFMIPLVYSNKPFPFLHSSFQAIALAGAAFCLINFLLLPGSLSSASRFAGLSRGAASFALFLGGLLPFTLWGAWKTKGWLRVICLAGLITGSITLFFSGQRTGTLGGLISLIPIFLLMQNRKTFGWSLVILTGIVVVGYIFMQQSATDRNSFLLSRYSLDSGLSGREDIWNLALAEIHENPVIGRGIGASEMFYSSSFHNTYLEVWYNTGFLGLLFFISAQVYFLYKAGSNLLQTKDPEIRAALVLALSYMLGYIAFGFFESIGAGASGVNLILYLFVGFAVSNPIALRNSVLNQPKILATTQRWSEEVS